MASVRPNWRPHQLKSGALASPFLTRPPHLGRPVTSLEPCLCWAFAPKVIWGGFAGGAGEKLFVKSVHCETGAVISNYQFMISFLWSLYPATSSQISWIGVSDPPPLLDRDVLWPSNGLLRCEAGMRKTPWVDLFFSGSELNEPVKEAKEEVLKGVCIQQQQLGGWWWWGCSWECWEKCVGRECWCWWRQVKKCWWLLLRWSVMARGQRPHPSNKYTLVAKHQIHFCLPNSKYTFEFCLLGSVTSQYTNYCMISVISIWAFVSIISMSQPRWQTYSNVQQKNCKNLHLLLPIREKLYLRT